MAAVGVALATMSAIIYSVIERSPSENPPGQMHLWIQGNKSFDTPTRLFVQYMDSYFASDPQELVVQPQFELAKGESIRWTLYLRGHLKNARPDVDYYDTPDFTMTEVGTSIALSGISQGPQNIPAKGSDQSRSLIEDVPQFVLRLDRPLYHQGFSRSVLAMPDMGSDIPGPVGGLGAPYRFSVAVSAEVPLVNHRVDSIWPAPSDQDSEIFWEDHLSVAPTVVNTDLSREALAQSAILILGVLLGIAGSLLVAAWQIRIG
jgi:hypothetical protein